MLLSLLFGEGILHFLATLPILVPVLVSMLVLHEISHGWVARWLGDNTAKDMGRLSLNPISHLDKTGTILFLLVGVGWAKPVPVNPYKLGLEPRKGMAIVGAAGPASNFLMAGLFAVLFRAEAMTVPYSGEAFSFSGALGYMVAFIVFINVFLGILNLIPLPPLDGFRIAVGILPKKQALALESTEKYASPILFGFFMVLMFTGFLWGPVAAVVNAFLGENVS